MPNAKVKYQIMGFATYELILLKLLLQATVIQPSRTNNCKWPPRPSTRAMDHNHHVQQLSHPQVLAAAADAIEKGAPVEKLACLRKRAVKPITTDVWVPECCTYVSLWPWSEIQQLLRKRIPFEHEDRRLLGSKSRVDIKQFLWLIRYTHLMIKGQNGNI